VLKNNLLYNRICFTCAKISKGKSLSKGKPLLDGRQLSKGGAVSNGDQPSGKKREVLWNAVFRNRAKRLGRETYRLMKARLSYGFDLILLIYPEAVIPAHGVGFCNMSAQLESLFTKAGLLK